MALSKTASGTIQPVAGAAPRPARFNPAGMAAAANAARAAGTWIPQAATGGGGLRLFGGTIGRSGATGVTGGMGGGGTTGGGGGPDQTIPTVPRPSIDDYASPSREGLDRLSAESEEFKRGFEDPRSTGRFGTLLGIAAAQNTRIADERDRRAQEIASRRGFVGGYSGERERADAAASQQIAESGFSIADSVSREYADLYGGAAERLTGAEGQHRGLLAARDAAYAEALAEADRLQAQIEEEARRRQEGGRQSDADRRQQERESRRETTFRERELAEQVRLEEAQLRVEARRGGTSDAATRRAEERARNAQIMASRQRGVRNPVGSGYSPWTTQSSLLGGRPQTAPWGG